MADRRWTDSQLDAINTRDRTLLVSAAAGSGKTATLTEDMILSVRVAVFPDPAAADTSNVLSLVLIASS